MAKLEVGQVMDLTTLSKLEAKVGTVVESLLDHAIFEDENLGTWYPLDGRSCIGTLYQTLTGKTEVPDATTEGSFLRQAKVGREVGSTESDAIRNITGLFGAEGLSRDTGATSASGALYQASRAHGAYGGAGYTSSVRIGLDASRVVPTADENRPKNIAVNYYIKVGY